MNDCDIPPTSGDRGARTCSDRRPRAPREESLLRRSSPAGHTECGVDRASARPAAFSRVGSGLVRKRQKDGERAGKRARKNFLGLPGANQRRGKQHAGPVARVFRGGSPNRAVPYVTPRTRPVTGGFAARQQAGIAPPPSQRHTNARPWRSAAPRDGPMTAVTADDRAGLTRQVPRAGETHPLSHVEKDGVPVDITGLHQVTTCFGRYIVQPPR